MGSYLKDPSQLCEFNAGPSLRVLTCKFGIIGEHDAWDVDFDATPHAPVFGNISRVRNPTIQTPPEPKLHHSPLRRPFL